MRETISTLRLRLLGTAALLATAATLNPGLARAAEPHQHFVGQVLASERVELASPVDGVLDAVLVDRGAAVHKGDVVATLNTVVQRVQVDLAQARAGSDAQLRAKREKHEFE